MIDAIQVGQTKRKEDMSCRRWIQHPITLELVPRDEYVRPKNINHYIQGDIAPFISPLDLSVVGGRREYRDHCAKHGVVPAQEFSTDWLAKRRSELENEPSSKAASKERKTMMYDAWTKFEQG